MTMTRHPKKNLDLPRKGQRVCTFLAQRLKAVILTLSMMTFDANKQCRCTMIASLSRPNSYPPLDVKTCRYTFASPARVLIGSPSDVRSPCQSGEKYCELFGSNVATYLLRAPGDLFPWVFCRWLLRLSVLEKDFSHCGTQHLCETWDSF